MANVLKMADINAIETLLVRGWSRRRIARELGLHRDTVARYAETIVARDSKQATNSLAGNAAESAVDEMAAMPAGEEAPGVAGHDSTPSADSKPAISLTGTPGRQSSCKDYSVVIAAMIDRGLSAQRVFQDLVAEHGFSASYSSVQRYVRRVTSSTPLPFRRMESEPGEESQVDFGQGAPTKRIGKLQRRRPHLFRIVLSFSRKAYSEVVWQQTTEEFIRCIENAFWFFGGVTKTLLLDNLRAAVSKADWFDPVLNPKFAAFCQHYGVVALPTKPRTPRHKGKVEAGIDYAQENAVKGHEFDDLGAQNVHLAHWEENVADQRIHGTTRQQVKKVFMERERQALLPLPMERFPFFHEAARSVHTDGHIAVEKAFYSVPPEFVARMVWARWDSRTVRIFDQKFNQIAIHARLVPGKFSTSSTHIAAEKISSVERGAAWFLERSRKIGPASARWAQALLEVRGIHGMRALQGFLALTKKHSAHAIERATSLATNHGAFQLKSLRRLLENPDHTERQVEFIKDHPLIRDPAEYGKFIKDVFNSTPGVS